jgi:hypothetical protein
VQKVGPIAVDVYGERDGSVPVPLIVQAEYFDKLPEDRVSGRDSASLEAPVVRWGLTRIREG